MTLLLFDLNPTGHHPGYLQHLIRYWDADYGRLVAVVSLDFPEKHPDIAALTARIPGAELRPIRPDEGAALAVIPNFLKRMAAEWRLMVTYAELEEADHVLLMYLDQFQLALFTEKGPHCPVSGILFRPTLHYPALGHPPLGWRERVRELKKKATLRLALRNRRLHTVFSSDSFCFDALRRFAPRLRYVALPDPVQVYPVEEATAIRLQMRADLPPDRKTLLLFGHLDSRKGLGPLAAALAQLPEATRERLTIWLVGPLEKSQEPFEKKMTELPGLEVRRHHDFVPDERIQAYFQAADGILALYQRHIGGSAVLVRAAAAERPALASDYGLVGQLVRTHGLGLALDATRPAAIARALTEFLETDPLGNPEQMRNFATQNRASEYARVIFEALV